MTTYSDCIFFCVRENNLLAVVLAHPDIEDMQLQSHVGLILGEDLNAVDMTEVGQQGHQVGAGVDDVTDAVTGPH